MDDVDLKSRQAVFPVLPLGNKYELVLDKADTLYAPIALPGDEEQRNFLDREWRVVISESVHCAHFRDLIRAFPFLEYPGTEELALLLIYITGQFLGSCLSLLASNGAKEERKLDPVLCLSGILTNW